MTNRTIQEFHLNLNPAPRLSRRDRRMVLRAHFRLLERRLAFGHRVLQRDVIRAASFADDAPDAAPEPL